MRIKRYMPVMIGLAFGGGFAATAIADGAAKEGSDLIARIHFVGTTQIASDPNAAKLNKIRALSESGPAWDEIAGKLATMPFRVMNKNSTPRTDDHAVLLRPLVEDVLRSETYWEMRKTTNAWPEVVMAAKIDSARADVWRSSLATVLADWTGIAAKDIEVEGFKGWELKKHHSPNLFRFVRSGDWVVFGWGDDDLASQAAIIKKIKADKKPVSAEKKNWLEAWIDWPNIMASNSLPLPFPLPTMELTVEARKDYLRPELKMQFAEPLGLKVEPWQIPTNVISDPISSIALARGFGPWLSRIPAVKELNADPLPDQAILWAMEHIPFQTCVVVPARGGTNYFDKIAPGLVSLINSKRAENNEPGKALITTNNEISFTGLPFLVPFIRPTNDMTGRYLLAGTFAMPRLIRPFPWGSILGIIAPTNVVYYDWEMNGERLKQWVPLSQLYYMSTLRGLPKNDTPVQKWLVAIRPELESCGTLVTITRTNELTAVRNGVVGLSGFELTCLALWVDSPDFPLEFKVEAPPTMFTAPPNK